VRARRALAPLWRLLMRLSTRLILAMSFAALSAAAIAGRFLVLPTLELATSLTALLLLAALAYALGLERGKRPVAGLADAMTRQGVELEHARSAAGVTAASMRHLFDGNPIPMYVYDQASLRFLDANDSAVAQYGHSRERFLTMTIEDIRCPGEVARLRASRAGMIWREGSAGIWEHRKADGTTISVEIIHRSILFQDCAAILVAAIDVTHACRVERELRDSQTRLKALADNLPGIVYQCRLTAGGEISYPYCSAAVSDLFGPGPDGGAGFVVVTRSILPEDRAAFMTSVRRSAAELSPWSLDFRCRRRNGTIAWFSGRGKPRRSADGDTLWDSVLIDISEQKNAEQALRESEAQLRRSREHLARAQRTADIGSWEIDLRSRSLEWSDELFRVLDLSREQVAPGFDHMIARFCPEDRERMRGWLELVCAGAIVPASEGRLLLPDGKVRWVRMDAAALRGPAGEIETVVGTVEVITQRKLVELELRHSQQHLARAQRIARVGSMEIDYRTGKWIWTDELYRLFGIEKTVPPSAELYCSLLPEAFGERFVASVEATRHGLPQQRRETTLMRPDGQVRTVEVDVDGLADQTGEVISGMATFHDITEFKRIEAELRDNEAQLRRSQEHLKTAQRVAAIGSFEHRIGTSVLDWSEETYRIFGIEPGTLITVDAQEALVLEEDREGLRSTYRLAEEGQPVPAFEYRIRRSDGVVRTLHRECETLRDAAGAATGIIGVCRDVTELRAEQHRNAELEVQLHHAQRMESLGTLAGGIAHDLNNTLLPVMVLADALRRKLPAGSPDAERLELIRQAGDRARSLVRQILAFSRREDPNKTVLDLAALIRQSMGLVRAGVPTTVRIEEQIDHVAPVLGDAGQLHQVLLNLIGNAIDAIGDSIGTITLALNNEAQAVAGSGAPPGPCVHFSVADTGCGMDEATLKRIFEPFFTTKAVGQGTGLGLSVVHGIVTSHGGRIEATSRRGQGTRFDIFLPALGAEQPTDNKEIAA
jgi:PAS domain S-box-containing protein